MYPFRSHLLLTGCPVICRPPASTPFSREKRARWIERTTSWKGSSCAYARILDFSAHSWHPIHRGCYPRRNLNRTQARKLHSRRLDGFVLQFGGAHRPTPLGLHRIVIPADHASGGPCIHRSLVDPDLDLALGFVAILSDLARLQQIQDVPQAGPVQGWDHQVLSKHLRSCEGDRRCRFVDQDAR